MHLHPDIEDIPYKHKYEIKNIYNDALSKLSITHCSTFIINPSGETIYFSSNPTTAYSIIHGYGSFMCDILTDLYPKHEFIRWDEIRNMSSKSPEILKELDLTVDHSKNGFFLVRKINDFVLIYSFALSKDSTMCDSNVVNNLNPFLKLGDHIYNQLQPIVSIYNTNPTPPIIEEFHPFIGGAKIARYTKNYIKDNLTV